ncbi:MAG: HD domain-containing protein [Bacteroidales bacterium]|nr:HD domain-containing protein [Bacteroidales bacterium]
MDNSQGELIYKNSRLEQELNETRQEVERLKASYEKALGEIDRLEGIISGLPKDVLPQDITIDTETGTRLLRFKMATVMYVDMRGYKSNNNEPRTQSGVDELDQIIIHFADVAEAHNLQIIKTIGDAFMCVGGIPEKNITNPVDVVLSAMEMVRYAKEMRAKADDSDKFWELRIGIHTGPVVATVNGKKKFSYDIKGETVNIATRMAAAAEHDKINVSVYTYDAVREYFVTDYNGVTPVKYHGDLEMYYIRRLRPALSVNKRVGEFPNEIFKIKYALRQFTDLQESILDKLERELPKNLYYHNYKHTIDVVNQSELIGLSEGLDDSDILLLKTAALFHDSGLIIGFDNHEFYSTQFAREILPKWHYTEEQIDKICEIIMATKLPPNPHNLLEKVICDADLDYLGREDFIPVSNNLYKELRAIGKDIDINTWNKQQVAFLSTHQYFTNTAQKLREEAKESQIERLKKLIVDDAPASL